MKTWSIMYLLIGIAAFSLYPGLAGAQGSRCVILEKDGDRALVSCNGKPSRYVDLRGKADMYTVGDSVDVSEPSPPNPESRPQRHR